MTGKLSDQGELKEIKRRLAAEASSRVVVDPNLNPMNSLRREFGDVAAFRYEATDQLSFFNFVAHH